MQSDYKPIVSAVQIIKNCTLCKKEFKSNQKYRLYCWSCTSLPNKNTIRISKCVYCNKEFEHKASHAKYCSKNCVQLLKYSKVKTVLLKRRSSLEETLKYVYQGAKSRAKKKGKDFNITLEFLYNLLKNQDYKCIMTGIPLQASKGGKDPYVISIDRIDSSKGYTKDNVALVTTIYNTCKNHYSIDNVIELCKGFIKTNKINING